MIPALAFNDAKSSINTDEANIGRSLAAASRKLNQFSPLTSKKTFQLKSSFIRINDLGITSVSSNGLNVEVEGEMACDLTLPLSGHNHTTIDGIEFSYNAHNTSLLGICEKQRTKSVGSLALLNLQTDKLSDTYTAICGSYFRQPFPKTSQILSTEYYNISFSEIFKNLFAQIDLANGDASILSKLTLDDSFYRLCAMLVWPETLLTDETKNGKRPYVRPEITRLCEYIAAHLTETISLTEMETRSGLSARILQRSFQNTFGLPPKQWVRKQRLHAARRVMLNRREPISITALAYDFCFASPSDFAHHYALEFGELPSRTLVRERC